jgi:DNA modification methylase
MQRQLAAADGREWGQRQTAELIGVSVGTVNQAKQIVKAAEDDPSIRKEEGLVGALRKVDTKKKLEERKRVLEQKAEGKIVSFPAEILVGDALELIKKEPDEEFDCIVTNFPFGVEYGYSGKADAVYKDDESYIVDLVRQVVKEGHRVLKNDSWFFAFFDIRKITYSNPSRKFATAMMGLLRECLQREVLTLDKHAEMMKLAHESLGLAHWFEEAGFSYVNLMPIIWAKPNKRQGNVGDPRKGLVVAYEAAIIAAKGDAVLLKQGQQDIFIYDTLNPSERDFEMQMPIALCEEIVSWLTLGKGRVLDPFAGVGSFGEGALNKQCSFRGYELNPERADKGNLRLREHVFAKVETQ